MAGIFGIVRLESSEPSAGDVELLSTAMARWGRGGCRQLALGGARFGRVDTAAIREPFSEPLPARCRQRPGLFTAAGRLDNRDELRPSLDLPPAESASDEALMMAAYERWGEACADRLLGDWSFAAWHPDERRLVLARDQLGNAALYHARVGDRVAFASHVGPLAALPWVPKRLNETRLAHLLVPTTAEEDGSGTIYRDLHLLRPGHTLCLTPREERRRAYWRLEPIVRDDVEPRPAHAEALVDGLRTAVRGRVRSDEPVGATLSAGLDSSAIAVLAARELGGRHRRLTAFTSVLAFDPPWVTIPGRILDEGPLAARVAASAPNIDHVLLDARAVGPIGGVRTMLDVLGQPFRAAGSAYWLVDLVSEASRRGMKVLLTGQYGNGALSWRGPQPGWRAELRRRRFARAARLAVGPWLPARATAAVERFRLRKFWAGWDLGRSPWRPHSAISPSFAREAGLDTTPERGPSPAAGREFLATQLRRTWQGGNAWAKLGAAFGLSVRDPSQDIRVIALALSMPDRLWDGPLDRWLFRAATDGIVPDAVRLNPLRGLQGADVVDRLRGDCAALHEALEEIDASPLARRCLDVAYCRRIAAAVDGPPDPFVSFAVGSILLPALGAGLFLATFGRPGRAA